MYNHSIHIKNQLIHKKMSTMSKRTMWIEPTGDFYRFKSEQTTSVRTLVEQLKGDYPDIIENPSKYVMKWPYNDQGDDQGNDQDARLQGRIVSLDDMIHLPDREFYFYIVNSSEVYEYDAVICTKTVMSDLDEEDNDFMAANALYEKITFPAVINDQAHLIKIISDQLGVNPSSIEGVYDDMEPINITRPCFMGDECGGFDNLYIVISYSDIVLKKNKDFEMKVAKMRKSLETYLIKSKP